MENVKILDASLKQLDDILLIQKISNEALLSKSNLENDLKNKMCKYFIAYINEEPIAYLGSSYVLDSLDILSILVNPNYRNKGIATKLIKELIKFCSSKDIKTIFLEVRKSNNKAIMLYESFNFTKVSERKNYYKNEDAIIYVLNL